MKLTKLWLKSGNIWREDVWESDRDIQLELLGDSLWYEQIYGQNSGSTRRFWGSKQFQKLKCWPILNAMPYSIITLYWWDGASVEPGGHYYTLCKSDHF